MITIHTSNDKEIVFHNNEYTDYEFVTGATNGGVYDPIIVRFDVFKNGIPVGLFFLGDDEYVHIKEDDE